MAALGHSAPALSPLRMVALSPLSVALFLGFFSARQLPEAQPGPVETSGTVNNRNDELQDTEPSSLSPPPPPRPPVSGRFRVPLLFVQLRMSFALYHSLTWTQPGLSASRWLQFNHRCVRHFRTGILAGLRPHRQAHSRSPRSPGSGLYDNLQQYDIPYPEAIFEINYFSHNPKPFFALAKQLYPGHCKPNCAHYFVRLLHQKELLLRMYTQNIDGLERMAGIPPEKLVEAHGTFATATCTVCLETFSWEQLREDVMQKKVPRCPSCSGVIKPDIVFFGEQLPAKFHLYLIDLPSADLLIILGTSLEVEPFASLSEMVRKSVPRVLINQDLVGSVTRNPLRVNDVVELGDIVGGVKRFSEMLGWNEEINNLLTREHEKLNRENTERSKSH
ncbi:NAD-dependent protein deacetylase sirtuin-3, mitochondrial isoform X3 [Heterodontus francisci]|uniref:NAD-dependent protein deacetylase sirtuin-3, mitochondrial isoform X3 n=1 Tax=Heterodontus francisci TaxID=7792 RepID=UPI00355C3B84